MSSRRLPSVRLPSLGSSGEAVTEEGVMVDLPPSNKFGFAWPAETTGPLPPTNERSMALSSSDAESDLSDAESMHSVEREEARTNLDGSSEATPTSRLNLDQNPIESAAQPPTLPKLSRAFSMPLPSQLGHLKNPRRTPTSTGQSTGTPANELSMDNLRFQEVSWELADSVQMVIQTLLQLSPPQVLDPAKEQFAGCALAIPTPSISAMFTSMKNLNYISAHLSTFSMDPLDLGTPRSLSEAGSSRTSTPIPTPVADDFDIAEMLQSVGDTLSGMAADSGVDLVIYHSDVGMKHVAVKGDECGISCALSHIVRHVISTAARGDSVEIGLSIASDTDKHLTTDAPDTPGSQDTLTGSLDADGALWCSFDIAHKFASIDSPSDDESSASPPFRSPPQLQSLLLRRLLGHVGATLESDLLPKNFPHGRSCRMSMSLEHGDPSIVNPSTESLEDSAYYLLPHIRISNEPTLEELLSFAETLKGKKVALHASSKGSFAHHLSSYLTAWGLDVSHISSESGSEDISHSEITGEKNTTSPEMSPLEERNYGMSNSIGASATPSLPTVAESPVSSPPEAPPGSAKPPGIPSGPSSFSFIFIDDDVAVLRERLRKFRAEQPTLHLNPTSRKRPALSSFHRPRSSPQVARAMGYNNTSQSPSPPSQTPPFVIVHFTSLANFKLVKDAIQVALAPTNGSIVRPPEVIVIPKPAGPRRFLTALHTAVTKPIVDPFFSPIATSPVSPGMHLAPPFFGYDRSPKSPLSRPSGGTRTSSDRSNRSPKEHPVGDGGNLPPPSPLGMSDGMEYFSEAAVKLGTSPSSGLVIQSPDGQPAGIFFHPRAKGSRNPTSAVNMERDRGQLSMPPDRARVMGSRRGSSSTPLATAVMGGIQPPTPDPLVSPAILANSPLKSTPLIPQTPETSSPPLPRPELVPVSTAPPTPQESPATPGTPASSRPSRKGSYLVAAPPGSPRMSPTGTSGPRRLSRRSTDNTKNTQGIAGNKKATDGNIVPPISVLIVDDNPINQTILSTFMKKKKIKFDVAKNGEEAVQKWRSGGFHLILMDIQMPVMDGIEATKEIRRLEKQNGSGNFPTTPQSEGQRTPSDTPSTERSANTPYRSSVIIVALTASSLQSDRVAALAAGCNDFLTKPVSLQWLNSKIIEWGSIKALQMWADLRPEVVKTISTGQAVQAQNVARRLHVPDGLRALGAQNRSPAARRSPVESNSETPRPQRPNPPIPVPSNDSSPHTSNDTSPSTSDSSKQLKVEGPVISKEPPSTGNPPSSESDGSVPPSTESSSKLDPPPPPPPDPNPPPVPEARE
ncbi:hypothetical protein JAAARDRAFT_28689 [Jaapia argillacea MUCL 33604]|uniref:Response regulatory domain-containing protein n=1 Tax=Jaapia argillacea MUCL 33604 TaxID=933084 RepID=A0A067QDK9_9AGAM|nr:hypothetical protein JAAARDRAFT_28689 [Jaapia argillacea MUCL 33604]